MECLSIAELQEHTSKDEILQDLSAHIYTIENLRLQITVQLIQRFLMSYLRWRINYARRTSVIPTSLIDSAVERAHQGGHPGESNLKHPI